jgi:hypothetical protein
MSYLQNIFHFLSWDVVEAGQFPVPKSCEVHTACEDCQSHPDAVTKFFGLLGLNAVVAEGRGHSLGEDYVGMLLDR